MKRCPTPRFKAIIVTAAVLVLFAVSAFAQLQSGNIYGKVQTKDGSVLPGVTVTLTGVGGRGPLRRRQRRNGREVAGAAREEQQQEKWKEPSWHGL